MFSHHGRGRESLFRRLRRAYYYQFDGIARGVIGLLLIVGVSFGLMHFTFFYGGLLDEALNYNIDVAYVSAGVNPTRNSKEADKLNQRFDQLESAKQVLRSKKGQEALAKYSEEELKAAYNEFRSSPEK